MLKENWRLISRVERVGDAVITVAAFVAAYYGRASLMYWNQLLGWGLTFEGPVLAPLKDYTIVLLAALISNALFLNIMGAYGSMRLSSSGRLFRMFLLAALFTFFTLAATSFILKLDLSRSFIGLFCVLLALFLSGQRYVVLELLRYWRRRGLNFRNVVVCGVGAQAVRLAREIASRPELGIKIRAFASLNDKLDGPALDQFRCDVRGAVPFPIGKIIHGIVPVEKALKEYAIDEVVFTDFVEVLPQVEELVAICAEQGVRTTIAADLFSIGMVKSGISYFGGIPLIHFQSPPGDRWELSVKRLVDILVSGLLLILFSPLFLLISLLLKLSSRGPVFYVQLRVGLNGRLFNMFKFRSMRLGAETELENLRTENEMEGPVFKIKNDPRITGIGRFLRRFSMDELPQLWNVFRGDMSLVGPRPPVPGEVNAYERRYRRRLSMRPGMTCIWQVSGRNEIKDFDSWVKLDLQYIDNWSLFQDFVLLFRTIPAVLFGTGAR